MAGIELLAEYGIELTDLNVGSLVKLRNIYEANIVTLKGESDKNESKDSELKKGLLAIVRNDETVNETVKSLTSEFRRLIYEAVDNNSDVILPLVEAISEIKTDILNERDFQLAKVKRSIAPKAVVLDEEYAEKYEAAENLASLIRKLYSLLAAQCDPDSKDFPLTPVKKDGKPVKGEYNVVLSRLPKQENGEESAPMGRNAGTRFLKFTWNGEPVPEGTLVNELAHDIVSDFKSGVVVTWKDISDAVKESGSDLFAREPWTVTFPTGTLTGYDPRVKKDRKS